MTVRTWLVSISLEECERLLAGAELGRLGVVVDGRPEIFPVNHVFDEAGHSVLFPSCRDGTKLEAALDWPWVAFEVDGEDPEVGGWSVLVVGHAEEVTDPEAIACAVRRRHVPWGSPETARWIRIVPAKTTGRRISAVAA